MADASASLLSPLPGPVSLKTWFVTCVMCQNFVRAEEAIRATMRSPWINRPCHAEATRTWSLARLCRLIVGRYNTQADIELTPTGNASDPSQGVFIFSLIFLLPTCGDSMIEPGWDTPRGLSGGSSGSRSTSWLRFREDPNYGISRSCRKLAGNTYSP